jgi:PPM family protein phosphatase
VSDDEGMTKPLAFGPIGSSCQAGARGGPCHDRVLADNRIAVLAVADGMGTDAAAGHAATAVIASLRAIGPECSPVQMLDAIRRAHDDIQHLHESMARSRFVGTTVCAVVIEGQTVHVAHLGDSRCYRVRHAQPTLLTTDHSLAAAWADAGVALTDSRRSRSARSALTKFVGDPEHSLPTMSSLEAIAGDRFVICTDGVHRVLSVAELAATTAAFADPADAAAAVLERVRERRGVDDAAIVVAEVVVAEGVVAEGVGSSWLT